MSTPLWLIRWYLRRVISIQVTREFRAKERITRDQKIITQSQYWLDWAWASLNALEKNE